MNNFVIQKKIINQIKNDNKKISKVIDPSISPYSYMTPWAKHWVIINLKILTISNLVN